MNRLQAHELGKLIKKVSEMEKQLNAIIDVVNTEPDKKKRGRPAKQGSYGGTD